MSKGKYQQDVTASCPVCGHEVPDGKKPCIYCGAALIEGVENVKSKTDTVDEDIRWTFSLGKPGRRPIQLSPVIQALIFLLSAAIGGFLVFLMG